jgi:hypothetical protein
MRFYILFAVLVLMTSCLTIERSELYDGHKLAKMNTYEEKIARMSREKLKQEAEELLADIRANEIEIERLTEKRDAAYEARQAASDDEVIDKGAALVKVKAQLKNVLHRRERMQQISAIIKSGYSGTFDPDE